MLPSGEKGQAGKGWYAPGRGTVVPASIPRRDDVDVVVASVMVRSMVWVRPGEAVATLRLADNVIICRSHDRI
jgi:hypothetical protein